MNLTDVEIETAAIVELLKAASIGSLVTYAAMSEAARREIHGGSWPLKRARRITAKEHGVVFSVEIGEGYKRLATDQLHAEGSRARDAIRRRARTARRLIEDGLSRANDLSPANTRQAYSEISVLGLMEHLARNKLASPVDQHDTRPESVAEIGSRLLAQINNKP